MNRKVGLSECNVDDLDSAASEEELNGESGPEIRGAEYSFDEAIFQSAGSGIVGIRGPCLDLELELATSSRPST